jgi:gliding motility-associated-like protein
LAKTLLSGHATGPGNNFPDLFVHNPCIQRNRTSMKRIITYPILLVLLLHSGQIRAQLNVQIEVISGNATTTCTDPIGSPDPFWSINIDNAGWVTYPQAGPCFTALPNVQFNQSYQCLADIPPTIQVCFRAFENDPSIFDPCTEVTSCLAEGCIDLPIPPQGSTNFDVQISGGASAGNANLSITTTGIPGGLNDFVCNALDIGVLQAGTTVGDADTSIFNNFCGTNINEPNPGTFGIPWVNNRAVWYQFTTGPNPGTHIKLMANSDPSNFGDPVNLQLALFTTDDNTCTGTFSFVTQNHDPADWGELLYLRCPQPNTTYFVMVDAVSDTPEEVEGYFGIEISELGVEAAPDLICEAEDLGAVPLGGSVSTPGPRSNVCSSNADAVPAMAFGVQASVWFTFQAPPTGHVLIEGVSDTLNDNIGLQLAAYASSDNTCAGTLSEIYSQYTDSDLDETIELHCLEPGQNYFLMVDGGLSDLNRGIFTLSVSDAGDETPVANIDTMLCAGESLPVGNSVYSLTGIYADTLQLPGGCDSIVNTNLTVLEQVQVNLAVTQQGLGPGNTDGEATVSPSGGTGNYTIAWSNGQISALATGLIGGDNYCVQILDDAGCMAGTCFDMPYFLHFVPQVIADTLDCNGDADGVLRITATTGTPPYLFSWQNGPGTLTGSGIISADGEIATVTDLPAGVYNIQITDIHFDTTVVAEILQPEPLAVSDFLKTDASCFGECDGSLGVTVSGGTPPYFYSWANGATDALISGLCAGGYNLTITDANGCTAEFFGEVQEPLEFIATASEVNPVSCFMGSDGEATVSTNGSPVEYLWSNSDTTETISGLSGGTYSVEVTNANGCTATTSVLVNTPSAPVGVVIVETTPVTCSGDADGELLAQISGPGSSFGFSWSTGSIGPSAGQLAAGSYSVTVTNELGCTAEATYLLTQPAELVAEFTPNQLTCFDEPDGGIITVDGVTGGVEPYTFSTGGLNFSPENVLGGYYAGEQVFFVQDGGGCVKEFFATIEGPVEIAVDAGLPQSIELGETAQLSAVANLSTLTFQWEPPEWTACPDCPQTEVRPIESTLFTMTATDTFGCTATSEVMVEVLAKRKVYVPNAFSPNADGINDEFVPFGGNDVALVRTFKIFDRQGNMVFETAGFQPGDPVHAWDGRFKGKLMQPAVFAWFAEVEFIDHKTEMYSGDVTLVR